LQDQLSFSTKTHKRIRSPDEIRATNAKTKGVEGIGGEVVHPVGADLAEFDVDEVVPTHLLGIAARVVLVT
jgi:hypothetical protein